MGNSQKHLIVAIDLLVKLNNFRQFPLASSRSNRRRIIIALVVSTIHLIVFYEGFNHKTILQQNIKKFYEDTKVSRYHYNGQNRKHKCY